MTESLDIVLADDHVVFLDAMTALLTQLGHRVRAAVSSAAPLVNILRAFQPDICVLELGLPDGGIDLISRIATECPQVRIVVLTADPDPALLHSALTAGASGYVHKTRNISVLLDVLFRVAQGQIVIEGSFARPTPQDDPPPPQLLRLATYLTPRESECLAMLSAGMSTTTMAKRIGVSTTTVRSHVQAVLSKLGVHSRLEAASLANRYGLVSEFGREPARAVSSGA
jgi:two-component system, NarL family, nitrate/nitrite response regulator NarL